MLMRSTSTPVLNSLTSQPKDALLELEIAHQIPCTRSITLATSSNSLSTMGDSMKKMTRALSDIDLRDLAAVPKKKPFSNILNGLSVEEDSASLGSGLFHGSELNDVCEAGVRGSGLDGIDGGCGGSIPGGGCGGGGGDYHGGSGFGNSDRGSDVTDAYYRNMIRSYPGNSLLLGNYAKFLKEVCGDLTKSEEYCSRSILENPSDGNVLSMYADLIWQIHHDAPRAENYFDQAVKVAPNDSHVMASYARFLWDVEDEDENESGRNSNPSFFPGGLPPLAAAAS